MKTLTIIFTLAALGGCASMEMRPYVGKDIREVMLDKGPPLNAIDMGDGTRVFQWPFGGGAFTSPGITTTSGTVNRYGNQAWLSGTAITSPSITTTLPPCMLNYVTRWDEAKNTWMVTEYRLPKQLMC